MVSAHMQEVKVDISHFYLTHLKVNDFGAEDDGASLGNTIAVEIKSIRNYCYMWSL